MRQSVSKDLSQIAAWYATTAYGRWEGPGCVPYYCDPGRIGAFAVAPAAIANGQEEALFKLLVTISMYQSRRDVDIMAIQRSIPHSMARSLTSPKVIERTIAGARCELLCEVGKFDDGCTVYRDLERGRTSCTVRPRTGCHVKQATEAIGRMGDMGKIPTSAWLRLRAAGGFAAILRSVAAALPTPASRAEAMVTFLSGIHRIGVKLATMFVSALATPALVPGLTPWWPTVDGSQLVVVDANVARVIDALRGGGPKTYRARVAWLRSAASRIDLTRFRPEWPSTSPRILQQAIYVFRSRSNRAAYGDPCAIAGGRPCSACVPRLCPFIRGA